MKLASKLFKPFGVDLFCVEKKFLVFNLVSRDLKIKYRRSFLGFFWTLLHPIAMTLIYFLVFKKILKVEMHNYILFIISGILPWNFFSQSLSESTETLLVNSNLITKVPVPNQIFPFVICTTNATTLALSTPVVLAVALLSGAPITINYFLLPFLYSMLLLITYAASLAASLAFVYFRDLKHIIGLGINILFYSTPVLYAVEQVPAEWRAVFFFNPLALILISIREIIVFGHSASTLYVTAALAWTLMLILAVAYLEKTVGRKAIEII